MSAPAIVQSPREQWLARRRELLTASDAAAALGLHPTKTPSDVYLEKVGFREDEETEPMRWGLRLEDAIAQGYHEETGREVRRLPAYEIAIHPDLTWLGASLDREQSAIVAPVPCPVGAAGDGALELKATSFADRWATEPPTEFQIQLTIQMACKGLSWGSLAAFVSMFRPLAYVDRLFDRELFDLMVPKLEEFHLRVQRRDPPLTDAAWFSPAAVKKLFALDDGGAVTLDGDTLNVVERWEELRTLRLAAEKEEEQLQKDLRLRMGAAAIGVLPDGSFLTLETTPGGRVEAFDRAPSRTLRRTKTDPSKKGRK